MKLSGTVIKGAGFASLAFSLPTANVEFSHSIPLAAGVYVGYGVVGIVSFPAIIHVGQPGSEKFEAHLFGFSGDLYGQTIECEIVQQISPSIAWQSEEQMKAKVAADVALAKKYFGL